MLAIRGYVITGKIILQPRAVRVALMVTQMAFHQVRIECDLDIQHDRNRLRGIKGAAERAGDDARNLLPAQRLGRPRRLGPAEIIQFGIGLTLGAPFPVPVCLAMA